MADETGTPPEDQNEKLEEDAGPEPSPPRPVKKVVNHHNQITDTEVQLFTTDGGEIRFCWDFATDKKVTRRLRAELGEHRSPMQIITSDSLNALVLEILLVEATVEGLGIKVTRQNVESVCTKNHKRLFDWWIAIQNLFVDHYIEDAPTEPGEAEAAG